MLCLQTLWTCSSTSSYSLWFDCVHTHQACFCQYMMHLRSDKSIWRALDTKGDSDVVQRCMAVSHVLQLGCLLPASFTQPHVQASTWLAFTTKLIFDHSGDEKHHWVCTSRSFVDVLCDSDNWYFSFSHVIPDAILEYRASSIIWWMSIYDLLQRHFFRAWLFFPYRLLTHV